MDPANDDYVNKKLDEEVNKLISNTLNSLKINESVMENTEQQDLNFNRDYAETVSRESKNFPEVDLNEQKRETSDRQAEELNEAKDPFSRTWDNTKLVNEKREIETMVESTSFKESCEKPVEEGQRIEAIESQVSSAEETKGNDKVNDTVSEELISKTEVRPPKSAASKPLLKAAQNDTSEIDNKSSLSNGTPPKLNLTAQNSTVQGKKHEISAPTHNRNAKSSGRTTPSSTTSTARSRQSNSVTATPLTPRSSNKYQHVKSKVNSITDHKPAGGDVKIFSQKKVFNVTSKIGSLENANRKPAGGNVVIESKKLDFKKTAKPRIDAKSDFTPAQPSKKILTRKLEWNVTSKVGSLDNVKHKPTGGNVKIHTSKLEWKAESKVGSKDNITHKPLGGNVQIFNEKLNLDGVKSKVGSLDNAGHVPGGGNVNISEYRVACKTPSGGPTSRTSANNSANASRQSSISRQHRRTSNKLPGEKYPLTANQALGLS